MCATLLNGLASLQVLELRTTAIPSAVFDEVSAPYLNLCTLSLTCHPLSARPYGEGQHEETESTTRTEWPSSNTRRIEMPNLQCLWLDSIPEYGNHDASYLLHGLSKIHAPSLDTLHLVLRVETPLHSTAILQQFPNLACVCYEVREVFYSETLISDLTELASLREIHVRVIIDEEQEAEHPLKWATVSSFWKHTMQKLADVDKYPNFRNVNTFSFFKRMDEVERDAANTLAGWLTTMRPDLRVFYVDVDLEDVCRKIWYPQWITYDNPFKYTIST